MRVISYRLALAGGVALLAFGVSLWSLPAALIVAGASIAGAGFAGLYGMTLGGEG